MKQTEIFSYWLCECDINDTKFEIDYDTYIQILSELSEEKTNYRMVNTTSMTIDFDSDIDEINHAFYIVVSTNTFLQYSEI